MGLLWYTLNHRSFFIMEVRKRNPSIKSLWPKENAGSFRNSFRNMTSKLRKDISDIDQKVIAMYAKGMTTRQISDTLTDIYGFEASEGFISDVTDRTLPQIEEWQNRPPDDYLCNQRNWESQCYLPQTEPSAKRFPKCSGVDKSLVSGHIWSHEEVEHANPELGSGLWRAGNHVRESAARLSSQYRQKRAENPARSWYTIRYEFYIRRNC